MTPPKELRTMNSQSVLMHGRRVHEALSSGDTVIYWEEVDPKNLPTFEYIERLARGTIQKWEGKYYKRVILRSSLHD